MIVLTQKEPSEVAGNSRATVNRVLREEQQRGSVELQRGKTLVLDARRSLNAHANQATREGGLATSLSVLRPLLAES